MFPDLVERERIKEIKDLILLPLKLQQSQVIELRVFSGVQPCSFTLTSLLPLLPGNKGASDENRGWFRNLLTEADGKIMEHSGKMVLLFKILRLAVELKEKVYVSFQNPTRRLCKNGNV